MNSSLSGATSSSWVGTTVDGDCGGAYPNHLHQGYVDGWTRNSALPTRAQCDDDNGCDAYDWGSPWNIYQHTKTWYGSY